MRVVFVILHYLAEEETIQCVESLLNLEEKENEISIVIVDNDSHNNSGKRIQRRYENNKKIHMIFNDKNLGFAKGNNVGFKYAKKDLRADFIILLNNDTTINQLDFSEKIVQKYLDKNYSVLGPDIISADGYHQNPGTKQAWGFLELSIFRMKNYIKYLSSFFNHAKPMVLDNVYSTKVLGGDVEDTILHGACLIFSPNYVKNFDGLNGDTFLYMEEDILKLNADYYKFKMLYSSDLVVHHKEDAATNLEIQDEMKKIRRKYKMLIKSSKVYSRLKVKMTIKSFFFSLLERRASKIKSSDNSYSIDRDIPLSYLINMAVNRLIMAIRGKLKTLGIRKTGKIVFCGKKVKLKCKSKMIFGSGVTLNEGVYIDALSRNGVVLGNGSSIGNRTIIRCSGNLKEMGKGFKLGKGSSLADNCFVGASGGVSIGEDVIMGQNIRFHSSNHNFDSKEILIKNQGTNSVGISIGNNCWVGAGAVFLDNTSIGDGCVVAANTVVTKHFPDNSILAGVPARIVKTR